MSLSRAAAYAVLATFVSMSMPAFAQTTGTPQPSPLGSGVASPPSTPSYNNGNGSGDQTSKRHGHRRHSNQNGTSNGGTGSQGS